MARSEPTPKTRLVLITPSVGVAAALAHVLAACYRTADVAALILRFAPMDAARMLSEAIVLARPAQDAGVAALLDGRAELAVQAGFDGAHVTGIDALKAALPLLKPDRMVGCGGLATRHDSMSAAEAGADYVMFGEPDAHGQRPGFDAIRERVAWWAELFQLPCIGYAATLAEAGELARAGADFVALAPGIWNSSEGVGALAEAMQRIRNVESAK
jgi:thiamine-phosphate pyrophosphorylase